jgi:Flp pilus assembly protein TadD
LKEQGMTMRWLTCLHLLKTSSALLIGCAALVAGCRSGASPYTTQSETSRNPLEAQRLTMKAADAIEAKPPKLESAEKLLREALSADLYHGPAHNDLGVIYLKQGKLYEAAGEFEWARKLMPGHPDPRMNLALTLERAGRVDDALKTYASALEVYPGHVPTLQAMTRLQLRRNRTDDRTNQNLRELTLAGETPEWREWAQRQLSRAPKP